MIDKQINKTYDINQQKEKEKGSKKTKLRFFIKVNFMQIIKLKKKL